MRTDIGSLKQSLKLLHQHPTDLPLRDAVLGRLPELIAALERAEEVADQGCDYCEAMVTDYGPEGEAHGHWWVCGECSNSDGSQLFSRRELIAMNNALNEVCNGVDVSAFPTRIGITREEAQSLLNALAARLHHLPDRPSLQA